MTHRSPLLWAGVISVGLLVRLVRAEPRVAITNIIEGSSFTAPASLNLKAEAFSSTQNVVKVSFFANGELIGTSSNRPYALFYTFERSVMLHAEATDALGVTGVSGRLGISVYQDPVPASLKVGVVGLGHYHLSGQPVLIEVIGNNLEGNTKPINIFLDGLAVASLYDAPYTMVLPEVSDGVHRVKATYFSFIINQLVAAETSFTVSPLILRPLAYTNGSPLAIDVELAFTNGLTYLEASDDLRQWNTVWTNSVVTNRIRYTAPVPTGSAQRYFRAVVRP